MSRRTLKLDVDRETPARAVKSLPRARLSVVQGDVLNDRQHRLVVSFLETLVPVLSVESSAW